jgi:hypothetical protein
VRLWRALIAVGFVLLTTVVGALVGGLVFDIWGSKNVGVTLHDCTATPKLPGRGVTLLPCEWRTGSAVIGRRR